MKPLRFSLIELNLTLFALACSTILITEMLWDFSFDKPVVSDIKRNYIDNDVHTPYIHKTDDQLTDRIIDRPLFYADRRPFVPTLVSPTQRTTPQRQVREEEMLLSAVILTGETQIALIQIGKNKKIEKVKVGEEIQGWQLTDIQPQSVTLQKGSTRKHLDLLVKSSRGPGSTEKTKKNQNANTNNAGDKQQPVAEGEKS